MKSSMGIHSRLSMFTKPAISTRGQQPATSTSSSSSPFPSSSSSMVSSSSTSSSTPVSQFQASTSLVPTTLDDIAASLPIDQQPPNFNNAPLLAIGYRGTEYQLLVLLHRMLELRKDNVPFEALVEAKGFGNLDDIILKIYSKDDQVNTSMTAAVIANQPSSALPKPQPTQILAYQVKYYNHSIVAQDFFNQAEDTSSNAVMHIGKFFIGWLNLKKAYPNLSNKCFQSIVYSNNAIDANLSICIGKDNKWKESFIANTEKVRFNRSGKDMIVCKNFLFKAKVCDTKTSTAIWEALKTAGYIDEKKRFTGRYHPGINIQPVIKHVASRTQTNQTKRELDRISQTYLSEQTELYPLLYSQAWQSVLDSKKHAEYHKLSAIDKTKLFQKFLRSFQFQLEQPSIENLEQLICQQIAGPAHKQPADMYRCLYHAVHAWFRQQTPNSTMRALNNAVLEQFIKDAKTTSKLWRKLQGRGEQVLSDILDTIAGQHMPQSEFEKLQEAMRQAGIILVVGAKGAGKSALVKHCLGGHHKENYLAFSANNLTGFQNKLQRQAQAVLKKMADIKTVFIDAAEAFVELKADDLTKMLHAFTATNRHLILTITPEAVNHILGCIPQGTVLTRIDMTPLPLGAILTTFPMLQHYENAQALMRLARQPFFLSAIIKLIQAMDNAEFEHMLNINNTTLQYQMINLVIEGQVKETVKSRQVAVQWLTGELIKATDTHKKIAMPSVPTVSSIIYQGLEALIKDGVISYDSHRQTIGFSHDLFYDHSLINYINDHWLKHQTKNKGQAFWLWLNSLMGKANMHLILYQWLAYAKDSLTDDIIHHIEVIKQCTYFKHIKISPIINHNDKLFQYFLDEGILSTTENSIDVGEYYNVPTVLLTILHNYKRGLKILLNAGANPHHPKAGRVVYDAALGRSHYVDTKELSVNKKPIKITYSSDSSSDTHDDNSESDSNEYDSNTSHSSSHSSDDESSSHGRVWGDYYENSDDSQNLRSSPPSDEDDNYSEADSFEDPQAEELNRQVETFIGRPKKYHSAGFNEQPDFSDVDDEDNRIWIKNERYHPKPNPHHHYLHTAIISHSTACLRVLLDTYDRRITRSASLMNEYEETPLHMAALHHAVDAAKMLVEDEWVETDDIDIWGETPLHNAVYQDDIEIAKLLLSNEANPNIANSHGIVPIHIAIMHFNIEMVSLLLSYGASLSRKAFYDEEGNGLSITDLLDKYYEELEVYHADDRRIEEERLEDFVIKLIELLNFGKDDLYFIWKCEVDRQYPETFEEYQVRLNQLNQVNELMGLIEHRAQLSTTEKKFDYCDEVSELDYAIRHQDIKKIKCLGDSIFEDDANIALVFALPLVRQCMDEVLSCWEEYVESECFEALARYAHQQGDTELQTVLQQYIGELDTVDLTEFIDVEGTTKPASHAREVSIASVSQGNDVATASALQDSKVSTPAGSSVTTSFTHFRADRAPEPSSFGLSTQNSIRK